MSDDRIKVLREALQVWAKTPLADRDPAQAEASLRHPFNADECRYVFDLAGINIPAPTSDAVTSEFRKLGFYGGTFTQDANRLLAVLDGDQRD